MLKLPTFESFVINEAVFGQSQVDRSIKLLEQWLGKKLGGKFRRYANPNYVEQLILPGGKKGIGYPYFYGKNSAFRVNYVRNGVNFDVDSIHVYPQFYANSFDNPAPYKIHLSPVTPFLKILHLLVNLLKNPRVVALTIKNDPLTEGIILNEAKQVSLDDFRRLVVTKFDRLDNLTLNDLLDVCQANDVLLPSIVRSMGQDKNHPTIIDLPKGRGRPPKFFNLATKLKDIDPALTDADEKKTMVSGVDFLVMATDKATGKMYKVPLAETRSVADKLFTDFISSENDSEAEQGADWVVKRFDQMRTLVRMLIKTRHGNGKKGLIICGMGGTGKTYIVKQELKKLLSSEDVVWETGGKTTAASLYRTLFLNREKVIVIDDNDNIWKDSDGPNILKGAMQSGSDERIVSWNNSRMFNVSKLSPEQRDAYNKTVDDAIDAGEEGVKLPSAFAFKGVIIFISNLPEEAFDDAVLTRTYFIPMNFTANQMFGYVDRTIEQLDPQDMNLEDKKLVLDRLKDAFVKKQIKAQINVRLFCNCCEIYRNYDGTGDWVEYIEFNR